jgi:NADPH-dependent ferric siderophore reductase
VRLLLPPASTHELVIPSWNGNGFTLPDGRRPAIRTFTPRRVDPVALELDVEIVTHGAGVATEWAQAVARQPGGGLRPGPWLHHRREAPAFVLAGDETAIPAICRLLEALPTEPPVQVHIEVATLRPGSRCPTVRTRRSSGKPCQLAHLPATRSSPPSVGRTSPPGTRVWVAGEAAAMQRIRRHQFDDRGLPRAQASVPGYWKHGRNGDIDDDA